MLEEPLFVYDDKKKKWVRRNVRFEENGKLYFTNRNKFVYSKKNKMDLFKTSDLYKSVVAPSSYYYRVSQPNLSANPTFMFYIPSKDGKNDLWINFNSHNQLSQWMSKIRSSLSGGPTTSMALPARNSFVY